MTGSGNFSSKKRRPRPALVLGIALFHVAVLYGLAKALVPDFTGEVEQSVVAAFTVTVTTPKDEPPPPAEPEPDEGAQGDPGERATPKPTAAPIVERPIAKPSPAPQATSTGTANRSGAQDSGTGTGAAGSGLGTGSGQGGAGSGNGVATKPVHISGQINAASDFPIPPGGRAARRGTSVIVKVTVGVDGRARDCSIYRASPDPEADRITCQLVTDRLRFEPAKNARGEPVAAPFYWQQKWF